MISNNAGYYVESHPWNVPRNQSVIDRFFKGCLALIAFSFPLEGALPLYSSGALHSLPYYLSVLAVACAIFRLPIVLKNLWASPGFLLLLLTFAWSIFLYYQKPLRPHGETRLLVQLAVMAILFIFMADDDEWRKSLIKVYWVGWTVFLCLSLYDYLRGNYVIWSSGEIQRADMLLGWSPNQHAHQTGVGLLIALLLARQSTNWTTRGLLLTSIVLGSIVFLLGNSKSATLALLITVLIWCIAFSKQDTSATMINRWSLVVVSLSLFFVVSSQLVWTQQLMESFSDRFASFYEEQNVSGRDVLWREGVQIAAQHPFGAGQGNAQALMAERFGFLISVHNYYLNVLIEAGIIGFILFLIATSLILYKGGWWYWYSGDASYFLPLIFLLLISFSAGAGFHYKITWFFLGMNALTPLHHVREDTARTSKKGEAGESAEHLC